MRKIGLMVLLMSLVLGYGSTVLARGGGKGGGGHAGGSMMGGGGHAGGMASGYMSPQGINNTNAQWGPGATRGKGRAAQRTNLPGNSGMGQGGRSKNKGRRKGKH